MTAPAPARKSTRPRKQPSQGRSVATVSVILEATAHILVTEGYEHLNTNRVAERAGVSIGSLYQYFPNKQALLSALRQRHAQDMQSLVNELTEQALSQTLPQAIRTLVGAVGAAHRLQPRLHQVLEQEVPRQTQQAVPTEWETTLRLKLQAYLAHHQTQLTVGDVSVASLVLVRLVDALIHATLTPDPLGVSPQAIEEEISTVVLRYLTSPATPAMDHDSAQIACVPQGVASGQGPHHQAMRLHADLDLAHVAAGGVNAIDHIVKTTGQP